MSRARDLADGTFSGAFEADSPTFVVDAANNSVGIGVSSPNTKLHITGNLTIENGVSNAPFIDFVESGDNTDVKARIQMDQVSGTAGQLLFYTENGGTLAERARITSGGVLLVGQTTNALADTGHILDPAGLAYHIAAGNPGLNVNRKADDGNLVTFYQDGSLEGTISVSGTTVSYNGGHLARWSQTADNTRIDLLKGTVMTNLDQMAVWSHDTTYWTEEDDLPEGVAVGDVKREAFVEDNEQLNCMAVSSVEGDANVAGVFVNWDNDDGGNDMNVAMTGDFIIRIAQGTTVQRGDLLMSAGDGTAKPQGDDIIRSKTIAKVTSTHVTCTYEDGSYCVPCVLMAC